MKTVGPPYSGKLNVRWDEKGMIGRLTIAPSHSFTLGNIIKVPMDKIFNPVSKEYEWVPIGVWTITKPAPQSLIPSISANAIDSFASGVAGDSLNKAVPGGKNES